MKRVLLLLSILVSSLNCAFGKEVDAKNFFTFEKLPWRCIVTLSDPELCKVEYYDREGTVIARGRIGGNGEYDLYLRDTVTRLFYHATAKFDAEGNLVKERTDSRSLAYNPFSNTIGVFYYNEDNCDKFGNWTEAVTMGPKYVRRQISYYDDASFDAADAALIAELSKTERRSDDNFSMAEFTLSILLCKIMQLPAGLVASATWIYLFMLIFMRRRLYAKIDNYAGCKVTPNGYFSKVQLQGIVPMGVLAIGLLVGLLLSNISAGVWEALFSLAVEALMLWLFWMYCRRWVRRRSDNMQPRAAKASLFFAIMSIFALIAFLILAAYFIFFAVVIVVILFCLNSTIFSKLSWSPTVRSEPSTCRSCKYFDGTSCILHGYGTHQEGSCNDYERTTHPA